MNAALDALATELYVTIDDVWLIDSTPVECGRSRETAKRSNLAGVAGYGYCASHSRYFWGLRLHLIATPAGLPIAYALTNPKTMNASSHATCSSATQNCSHNASGSHSSRTRATAQLSSTRSSPSTAPA
jgi:hypothetical protein